MKRFIQQEIAKAMQGDKQMNIKNIVKAVGITAIAGLTLVGCAQEPQIIYVNKEVVVEKETIKYVNVTVFEEVEKVVEVQSPLLGQVLEYLDELEGDAQTVYDESDSIEDLASIMVFDFDNRKLAVDVVDDDLADELDHMIVNGTTLDEDDIKRIRIDDDFDEITLVDMDFEDEQVTYNITGTFEQDNDKFDFVVEVEMENYKEDDFTIISVTKQ